MVPIRIGSNPQFGTQKLTKTCHSRTVVQIWDSACGVMRNASFEVGPAVLRPDGKVFQAGANTCGTGHTAIFNSYANTWSAGPDFPVSNVSIAAECSV